MLKKIVNFIFGLIKHKWFYKEIDDQYKNRRILINALKSDFNVFAIDVYLGFLCAARGATVEIIFDNGVLQHHDFIQKSEGVGYLNPLSVPLYWFRYQLVKFSIRFLKPPRLNLVETSELVKLIGDLSEDQRGEAENLAQIHALDSAERYFQGTIKSDDLEYLDYLRLSKKNSYVSYKIGIYASERFKATDFYTSHAIYSCWGPAYDCVKNKNIRTLVYGVNTYFSGKLIFSTEKLQCASDDKNLLHYLGLSEKDTNINVAENYLACRFNRTAKDTQVYYQTVNNVLYLDKKKKNFLFCPNVFWDGNISKRDTIFSSMTDWLIETIYFAKNNPENNFFIRFHPAEVTWYSDCVKYSTIIREKVPDIDLISNVHILDSDFSINLYDFLECFDMVIAYDGMIALEAAFLRVPTMLVGRGRYSVSGFGIQPKSREEYFSVLGFSEIAIDNYSSDDVRLLGLKILSWFIMVASVDWDTLDNEISDFGTNYSLITKNSFEKENKIFQHLDIFNHYE